MKILAIPGSLRDDSYNRALLEAARERTDGGVAIELYDIGEIPHFDADVEAEGDPAEVTAFKDALSAADAILIATPEYQHGIPGVLKNALDWGSRPPGHAPLTGKPSAILGATPGSFGTARAQEQLRQILIYNDCPMVMSPEVLVSDAQDKIDDDGKVADEETLGFIDDLVAQLVELTRHETNA